MDYEKKYNEALERAKDYFKANQRIGELEENDMLSDIFPELKESEDERIRKGLIKYFKDFRLGTFAYLEPKKIIAWLEKQGEQKPVPKFEVGDVMRTLQESADNITSGLPVVVSIDDEYYRCNNELIAIKDQDDYEYPPMNRMQKPAWKPSDEQIEALEHFVRSITESGFASPYDSNTKLVYSLLNDLKKLKL